MVDVVTPKLLTQQNFNAGHLSLTTSDCNYTAGLGLSKILACLHYLIFLVLLFILMYKSKLHVHDQHAAQQHSDMAACTT